RRIVAFVLPKGSPGKEVLRPANPSSPLSGDDTRRSAGDHERQHRGPARAGRAPGHLQRPTAKMSIRSGPANERTAPYLVGWQGVERLRGARCFRDAVRRNAAVGAVVGTAGGMSLQS